MSHLTWEYSIIIGEETKNVNENRVQVIKQGITLGYLGELNENVSIAASVGMIDDKLP
jgi:hypothetical protein